MINRIYTILFLLFMFTCLQVQAQVRMRDVFAQMPDSIFPLLTQNNRLDCIDFIENDMVARVKNRFDEPVVLLQLDSTYLKLQNSEKSYVEMKLFTMGDKLYVCMNKTYLGPCEDSEVVIYDLSWNLVSNVPRPVVLDFVANTDAYTTQQLDTVAMIRTESETLPLIKATLSPNSPELCWTLQTAEFTKPIKNAAGRYLQPVIINLAEIK